MSDLDYSIYYSHYHTEDTAHAEMMAGYLIRELQPLLPQDKEGQTLDIGCGYGFALLALQRLGFTNIQGVETSRQQAERARQKGFQVDVVEDTTKWLNEQPKSFSTILLIDVLEHVPVGEQIELLSSIYRRLNTNGRLIVQVPNASAMLATRWRYNDFTHHSCFTEQSLNFALRNAGFEDVQIDNEKGLGRFPLHLWRKDGWVALRKYALRWGWLQVYKAELPWERLQNISFEINLKAAAYRRA